MMDINREQALILLVSLKKEEDYQFTEFRQDYVADGLVSDGLMMNDHNGNYVTTDVGVKALREYISRMGGDNKDV